MTSKKQGLKIALVVAALFTATSASAYSISTGGTAVPGQGLKTSYSGMVETDFNSGVLPANYTGGSVYQGSSATHAAPPGDKSYYYSVGPAAGSPGSFTLTYLANYFGFYQGSPDDYQSIEFFRGGSSLGSISGAALAAVPPAVDPNGNQQVGRYYNIWAGSGEYFDSVVFSSSRNAFETDNHAVSAVPLPAAALLFAPALLGFGMMRRKQETLA